MNGKEKKNNNNNVYFYKQVAEERNINIKTKNPKNMIEQVMFSR